MNTQKIMDCEDRQLAKLSKFQLPNHYKKVGVGLIVFLILTTIAFMFTDNEPIWISEFTKPGLLMGFLLISISREKDEDEMIVQLRSQSYSLAFVIGVLYAFVQPYVNYGITFLAKPEKATMDMSQYQVLFFMLLVQIMFFYKLKRQNS
jgi:hypothetical protein